MINFIKYVFCIIISVFLISCASVPSAQLTWDSSPNAYRQIFPVNRYIAQRGSGTTREAAELDGATRIARFLDSEISTHRSNIEIVGILTYETYMEIRSFAQSQINLYGIRYVADTYFDRRRREWVTVAYINRDEAWQVYAPRFRLQATTYNELFLSAYRETDSFRRVLRFITAQNHANDFELQSSNIFGQLLHPTRMNEEFSSVRTNMSRLPRLLDDARRNVSIYIDTHGDFNLMITNAFSRELSALGLSVTNNRSLATTICRVTVTEGRGLQDTLTFYNPSLQAVFSSDNGVLFTFTATGDRAVAMRPEIARQRAYQSLTDSVTESFSSNLME